jgi:hypothetical protein
LLSIYIGENTGLENKRQMKKKNILFVCTNILVFWIFRFGQKARKIGLWRIIQGSIALSYLVLRDQSEEK